MEPRPSLCDDIVRELIARGDLVGNIDEGRIGCRRDDVTAMAGFVVLVDRDPLYAWFVTEAPRRGHRGDVHDAASAVAPEPEMPASALMLVDGVDLADGVARCSPPRLTRGRARS